MSRAERIIKRLAKRHHLQVIIETDEELILIPHSLLISKDGRELINARGVIDDSDVTVSLRNLALPGLSDQAASIIITPLPFGLELVALSKQQPAHLDEVIRHLHPEWSSHQSATHKLALPISANEEQINATKHAINHLPSDLNAEVSDQHLLLFSIPPIYEEAKLESVLRLTIEVKHLFVSA